MLEGEDVVDRGFVRLNLILEFHWLALFIPALSIKLNMRMRGIEQDICSHQVFEARRDL
jgi:hypothetical protein